MIRLHTSFGIVDIDLHEDKAPLTTENFLKNVNAGHYTNTVFHRVIDGFMIQGGGFEPGMKEKPVDGRVNNEASNGLKNACYTVAMARTSDPHSAGAQFFINVSDNDFLDHSEPSAQGWGYCVFGTVVAGREVVDRITAVETGKRGFHGDLPLEDVLIERAEVV